MASKTPSLAFLKDSRALWLAREKHRYARWQMWKRANPSATHDKFDLLALRGKWYRQYVEAHGERLRRDKQIAAHTTAHGYAVSDAGVALIADFEGCILHPYQDSVGVWTIGYGHTENVGPHSKHLASEAAAKSLLKSDLNNKYAPLVIKYLKRYSLMVNQHEFDALVSFCYNCGPGYFERTHTIGDAMAARNRKQIANAFLVYDKAGGQRLAGLTRRRTAERRMFLS